MADLPPPAIAETALLAVSDLAVRYGRAVQALRGVSLIIPDGSIVAVLGNNGAGKSTLLRAISGVHGMHRAMIERGSIRFAGEEIAGLPPARIVRRGVVHVPEGRRIFNQLTVDENLRAAGVSQRGRALRGQARERVFAMFPVLAQRRRQCAGLLSGGEQQMLAIGRALMASPRLLVLDEPSLGLAPFLVGQIADVVSEISRQGAAVLLVEQNAAMALSVAQTAYVLQLGQVMLSGPVEDLRGTDEVRRLYLGEPGGENAPADGSSGAPRRTLAPWVAAGSKGRRE